MSTRREVRERVMQALYAYEQGGGAPEDVLKNVLRPSLEDDPAGLRFAERLFLVAIDRADETDAVIQQHVRNWEIGRIALVDRLVLRTALTEILAFPDIPPKVSINEAIEVAKRFSTQKSGPFVNGILDAALLRLIDEGKVAKTGRGLVGMPQARSRTAEPQGARGEEKAAPDSASAAPPPSEPSPSAPPASSPPASSPPAPILPPRRGAAEEAFDPDDADGFDAAALDAATLDDEDLGLDPSDPLDLDDLAAADGADD